LLIYDRETTDLRRLCRQIVDHLPGVANQMSSVRELDSGALVFRQSKPGLILAIRHSVLVCAGRGTAALRHG
jgi:hypothetical protein